MRVTGIDRSPEMLERARTHAKAEALEVTFFEGDMIDRQVDSQVDLVTCVYDAANYLADDAELRRFFASVSSMLTPDGAFAFDLNTRQRLSNSWEQGLMLAGDSTDLYVTYRSWFDESIDASPLIVTGFERVSESCWRRFDEEHIERSWPIDQVSAWLAEAGFQVELVAGYIDSTGDLIHPPREDHGRILFIAGR
jgi:SAM-dependent methyltransferase